MFANGNAWEAWLIGLLLYPGLGFAVILALGVEVLRSGVTALLAPPGGWRAVGAALVAPLRAFRQWGTAGRPARGTTSAWGLGGQIGLALAGGIAPVAALALMPLPGQPLAGGIGTPPVGDGLAVWALLLAGPLAYGVLGLGAAGSGAQLAGARRVQSLVLGSVPATLALVALATVAHSLRLDAINQALGPVVAGIAGGSFAAATTPTGLVGLLAGVVLVVGLPALAGWRPAEMSGVRPGPAPPDSILVGLPAPVPGLVWAGVLLQRAAWVAFPAVLLAPGAGGIALAVGVLVVGLAAWGARRLPPRPDQILGTPWALGLPLAGSALALALFLK